MFNNHNDYFCNLFRISNYIISISILPILSFFILFGSGNLVIFGQESNSESKDKDINIVVAGDFYCNDQTENTINNIISVNPELIITTGDHVKDEISADCWIEMSKPIQDKMKIAIGNHDIEFSNIYKQIVDYHSVKTPYYSHDFKNVHFISMSTEHPFEERSKQYKFIKNDLEKTSKNQDIDWIIVHQHKPFYSTHVDREEAEELRDSLLPLFEKYGVDIVISGHNQYYERTYPIFQNTKGIQFLTVGTAGDELSGPEESPNYIVIQDNKEYGFLNLKLENNGKTLVGEFRTGENNDDILDSFKLIKS